jgi:phenylacetate-CoA ligase
MDRPDQERRLDPGFIPESDPMLPGERPPRFAGTGGDGAESGDRDESGADRRLADGLARVIASNPFYRRKFALAGLTPADLVGDDPLDRLPFTLKSELVEDQRAHPPFGSNLTRPIRDYTRCHHTSGTSGRKLRWADTPESWEWVLRTWGRTYAAAGVGPDDRLFFPFSFGPFLGFWAGFESAIRRGLFVLPGGGLSSRARLRAILDDEITVVLATPSYALTLLRAAEEEGLDLAGSAVRALIVAGEPGGSQPAVRARMETGWGARVFDHAGLTETGPIASEAVAHPGRLFLFEREFLFEFLEPGGTKPVAEGEVGELVVTTLGRWDCPLIRYRTGDLVRHRRDLVIEGFSGLSLEGGVLGRADDMLWIRGNNVYPASLEEILLGQPGLAEFLLEARESAGGVELTLVLEPMPGTDGDRLAESAIHAVQERLYFRPEVRLAAAGSLPRSELKSRRLVRLTAG